MGPKCELSGNPCDILTSTCPKGEGDCFASGPGANMFESTKIIGQRIFEGAMVSNCLICPLFCILTKRTF